GGWPTRLPALLRQHGRPLAVRAAIASVRRWSGLPLRALRVLWLSPWLGSRLESIGLPLAGERDGSHRSATSAAQQCEDILNGPQDLNAAGDPPAFIGVTGGHERSHWPALTPFAGPELG